MPVNCLAIWSPVLVGSHVLEKFLKISSRDTLFCRLTLTPTTANEIMSTFYEYLEPFDNEKEGIIIANIM